MTTRCYEELQAKLENQQLPPLLSRETTPCTTSETTVYYERSSLLEGLQLQTITNWNDVKTNLENLYVDVQTAIVSIQGRIDVQTGKVANAASDANTKLLAYNTIVADELDLILTEDFIAPADYDSSGNQDAADAYEEYSKAKKTLEWNTFLLETSNDALNLINNLTIQEIDNGETVSIYIENDVLIGRIYRNVHGKFIEADFSEYYPFTIERIERYKIDEKKKTNKNNYLGGKLTKAQKWSKIAKNAKIRKRKILTSADKCSYAISNNQTN